MALFMIVKSSLSRILLMSGISPLWKQESFIRGDPIWNDPLTSHNVIMNNLTSPWGSVEYSHQHLDNAVKYQHLKVTQPLQFMMLDVHTSCSSACTDNIYCHIYLSLLWQLCMRKSPTLTSSRKAFFQTFPSPTERCPWEIDERYIWESYTLKPFYIELFINTLKLVKGYTLK